MKRTLLILAATLTFLSTLAVPSVVFADNGTGQCSSGNICKP